MKKNIEVKAKPVVGELLPKKQNGVIDPSLEALDNSKVFKNGKWWWSARALMVALGYNKRHWHKFLFPINRAIRVCERAGEYKVEEQFNQLVVPIISGKGGTQDSIDYQLTNYGCFKT